MTGTAIPQIITPSHTFLKEVEAKSKQTVSACFQCEKCTNGCPVTFAMDIVPHKVIRMINLGLKDHVLKSDTIWICASCETCTSRCPNDIDIAHVMDSLRQLCQSSGIEASQRNVPLLHEAFMSTIQAHGRIWELEMETRYMMKTKEVTSKDMKFGMDMFKRGKLKFMPSRWGAGSKVKQIFNQSKGRG